MSQPTPAFEAVAPLLVELARAVRAHEFFDPGHPTREHALRKAYAVWARGLAQLGELELEVSQTGFALGGVTPIDGSALDDLARALHFHQVMGLQVHPDLSEGELRALVEAIARDPGQLERDGRLQGALARAGVRHVALWEIPQLGARGSPPVQEGIAVGAESEEPAAPTPGPGLEMPPCEDESAVAELTRELVNQLAEIERCAELGEYRLAVNRVDTALTRMLTARNYGDAYRAALVYSRHATDPEGRVQPMRVEAQERLRMLLRDEGMLQFVIESAQQPRGTTSVKAVQVLAAGAPTTVPRLLLEHARADADQRKRVTAILIAMGEQALPLIVEELETDDTARARRASRLLGDLQHPDAVEQLADRLHHTSGELQREIATALSKIGSRRAIDALAEALSSKKPLAAIAAGALASSGQRSAVRALADVASERGGRDEDLRREAIRGLGRLGFLEGLSTLREILDRSALLARKKLRPLRVAAAHALGRIGGEEAFQTLSEHARGGDAAVSKACRDALRQMERAAGA